MRSPTVWSADSMNDVPLAVLMIRFRVLTGPIMPGSRSLSGRFVISPLAVRGTGKSLRPGEGSSASRADRSRAERRERRRLTLRRPHSEVHARRVERVGHRHDAFCDPPVELRHNRHRVAVQLVHGHERVRRRRQCPRRPASRSAVRRQPRGSARVREVHLVVPGPEFVGPPCGRVGKDHEPGSGSHRLLPRGFVDALRRLTRPSLALRERRRSCATARHLDHEPQMPSGMNEHHHE